MCLARRKYDNADKHKKLVSQYMTVVIQNRIGGGLHVINAHSIAHVDPCYWSRVRGRERGVFVVVPKKFIMGVRHALITPQEETPSTMCDETKTSDGNKMPHLSRYSLQHWQMCSLKCAFALFVKFLCGESNPNLPRCH